MILTCRPFDVFMTKVHSCHNNSSKHPVVAAPGSIKRSAMDLAGSWLAMSHKRIKICDFLKDL